MPQDFQQDYLETKPDIWSVLSRWAWLVVFCLLAVLAFLWILPEQRKRQGLENEVTHLQNQIRQQEASLEDLREELRLIREDPGYFEMIARDKLRLGKPGEYIIRLTRDEGENPPSSTAGNPAPAAPEIPTTP